MRIIALPLPSFLLLFVACSGGAGNSGEAILSTRAVPLDTVANGNVVLNVSNMSFEMPKARILIEIYPIAANGSVDISRFRRLFYEPVPVEDQHHWVSRTFSLPPGEYKLVLHEFETRTAAVDDVDISKSFPVFLSVQFWKSKRNATSPYSFFSVEVSDHPSGIL